MTDALLMRNEFIPPLTRPRPGTPIKQVKSITIHWVGPYPGQSVCQVRQWWMTGNDGKGIEASAHYVLKNRLCICCIPIEEVAYHAGCIEGNNTSIGIEVIPDNIEGKFSDLSIQALKVLLTHLPKVELKRHYDWTKKDCPLYYTPLAKDGQEHWDALIKELRA